MVDVKTIRSMFGVEPDRIGRSKLRYSFTRYRFYYEEYFIVLYRYRFREKDTVKYNVHVWKYIGKKGKIDSEPYLKKYGRLSYHSNKLYAPICDHIHISDEETRHIFEQVKNKTL